MAHLWDVFLSSPEDMWFRLPRTLALADDLLRELDATPVLERIPTTVLAALHRRHGGRLQPYDDWPAMEELGHLETRFMQGLRVLGNGRLLPALDHPAVVQTARAWPICLRSLARKHLD